MPALIVFESIDAERLSASLVKDHGFLQSMEGYSPSDGHSASDGGAASWHWPMLSHLPGNVLYAPDYDAKEAYRRLAGWANFNHYQLEKVVAFNVDTRWSGMISEFDHEKPGKSFDEIKREEK